MAQKPRQLPRDLPATRPACASSCGQRPTAPQTARSALAPAALRHSAHRPRLSWRRSAAATNVPPGARTIWRRRWSPPAPAPGAAHNVAALANTRLTEERKPSARLPLRRPADRPGLSPGYRSRRHSGFPESQRAAAAQTHFCPLAPTAQAARRIREDDRSRPCRSKKPPAPTEQCAARALHQATNSCCPGAAA